MRLFWEDITRETTECCIQPLCPVCMCDYSEGRVSLSLLRIMSRSKFRSKVRSKTRSEFRSKFRFKFRCKFRLMFDLKLSLSPPSQSCITAVVIHVPKILSRNHQATASCVKEDNVVAMCYLCIPPLVKTWAVDILLRSFAQAGGDQLLIWTQETKNVEEKSTKVNKGQQKSTKVGSLDLPTGANVFDTVSLGSEKGRKRM